MTTAATKFTGTVNVLYNGSNYSTLTTSSAGKLTITASGGAQEDMILIASSGGGGTAVLSTFQTDFKVWKFAKGNEFWFQGEFPHAFQEGSTITPHFHWSKTAGSGNGNVHWILYYCIYKENSTSVTGSSDITVATVADAGEIMHSTNFADVPLPTFTSHPIIIHGQLSRVNDGTDTYASSIWVHSLGIHFTPNKLGT